MGRFTHTRIIFSAGCRSTQRKSTTCIAWLLSGGYVGRLAQRTSPTFNKHHFQYFFFVSDTKLATIFSSWFWKGNKKLIKTWPLNRELCCSAFAKKTAEDLAEQYGGDAVCTDSLFFWEIKTRAKWWISGLYPFPFFLSINKRFLLAGDTIYIILAFFC